eukprot:scaffold1543_cov128-Skeletonema_menzelii.AAC.9
MKLKPSLLLSTAAAVLTSMPLAANAQQVDFLTCVFGAMASGEVTLDGSDMTALISTLNSLCCKEGNDEAVCTAFSCVDSETNTMVEPCTCGEAMGAQAEMKANVQMAMLVPSDIFSSTDAIFGACCPTAETTATEVNTCVATLPAETTTTAATGPISTGATDAPVVTTTAATEAMPTPTTAPSSGSIASVSLPMMIGYTLFNYVM